MEQQATEQQTPIRAMLESVNIAEKLDEQLLRDIGSDAFAGYEIDKRSRKEWEDACDEWTKLAKQHSEAKTWPWPKASNVKYPLLSTAAMQFAARAYPSLVPSDGRVVKAKVIGKDSQGTKTKTAEAVSLYMSYQLLQEMKGWEEDMDKLLIMLPVVGTMFKKTYWDPVDEVSCSKLVLPKNLVVNYWAKSLQDAERITEVLEMSPRKVKERQQSGLWRDVDLGTPPIPEGAPSTGAFGSDDVVPFIILEQHTFLDLDDDGYKEPYVVTFHKETHEVLRIVARFDEGTIHTDEKGELKKIEPIQYYTKFGFIPNPDGSFYDIGFGVLLGPLNESVNTLINQLVDAGSLSNLQSGFLGKGLRIRMGETRFQPGEWKVVNSTGDDLKKQIVPNPVREPSDVLFKLMGSLITSGKELASVAEIFVGKMPGQNTPATTTMATIEQGMKVFTAVYKRIYRSLAEEFDKLYRLNSVYVNPQTYVDVVDMEVGPQDFDPTKHDIFPGADPTAISQTEKLMKAQGLMELMPSGVLDPVKVVMRILDAQEQPNWQELLIPQVAQTGQLPPKPDPKMMEAQMKIQTGQQLAATKNQAMQQKMELEARDKQTQLAMAAQEHQMNMQFKEQEAQQAAASQLHKDRMFTAQEQADFIQNLMHKHVEHSQKMQTQRELAAAKKQQMAQKPKQGASKK